MIRTYGDIGISHHGAGLCLSFLTLRGIGGLKQAFKTTLETALLGSLKAFSNYC